MRWVYAIALWLLVLPGCSAFFPRVSDEAAMNVKTGVVSSGTDACVPGPEHGFPAYERLTYEMRWVGIPVGIVAMTIKGKEELNGRPVYVLEATARTNAFCSAIYNIDDRFISYMDAQDLCTVRHEVHRKEGSFSKDSRTDFDQVNHKAYYTNLLENTSKEFDIPVHTQDTLTAAYYFRFLPMRLGDRVEYSVCNNEKNYRLLALIGSRGTVRLAPGLGVMRMFTVEPFAELSGERVDKGRVSAYYSWDERRLPLFAVIKAPVFTSVTVMLSKIETKPAEEKK